MSDTGRLRDTYVAAIQHDLAELPEKTTLVGVVREPTSWFHAAVDENRPALAPPTGLLEDVRAEQETLESEGVADAVAHNQAMAAVDFDRRYREHLDDSDAASSAIEGLIERLRGGKDVALVCYENTDEKRCHRTLLRERIEKRR
ncbi:DUF488 domain-containing protein [Natronoarchaeum mannanilyticum]|uniref:DUF488 domain-containing protein n=1 Tax=Natronoarchaeum mannanilyticum TaxID=926360 RepID=A0AAV3TAI7_9EURY